MIRMQVLKHNIIMFIKNNYYLLFIAILCFTTGIISGSISVKILSYQQKLELTNFVTLFLTEINNLQGEEKILLRNTLAFNLKYITSIWLLSISLIGSVLIPILLFLQAFILGFTVSFLIDEFLWFGVLFSLSSVLSYNLFLLTGLILASFISLSFVKNIIKFSVNNKWRKIINIIKEYSLVMLIISFLFIIAAIIEAVITPRLTNLILKFF